MKITSPYETLAGDMMSAKLSQYRVTEITEFSPVNSGMDDKNIQQGEFQKR